MKKIITGVLMLCPIVLLAQNNFTIKGNISAPGNERKKVYLSYDNGEKRSVDSTMMKKNGEFDFSGTMLNDEYNEAKITVGKLQQKGRTESQIILFARKGDKISVNIKGLVSEATITGSEQSEAYRNLQDSLAGTRDINKQLAVYKQVIQKYPDSKMALAVFAGRFGQNLSKGYPEQLPEILNIYNAFSSRIKSTKDGAALGKAIEDNRSLVIGGILPDFTAKTPEGKVVNLHDFRGKYVLVDFWASWCIPCRAEFPFLKKAYSRFKSKNFEILGFSIDNERSLWVSALENDDVPWLNISNLLGHDEPAAIRYQIYGIPANFLIDPDGKVIAVNLRGEMVEPTLEKFIK
ncbi:redoxin domain-containing protein [Mucilaginibacter ximonensis]|uniref:Redoxin domain-containing protein n=1 Tax=Mucilaginibacter ximonensis TaxID=538021 RepID=A0ABW5YAS5_9SPHI